MELEQQFLVRLVNGGTRCIRFAAGEPVCCEDIKARVFQLEGIPPPLQRIVTGTRELHEGDLIQGDVAVLLRLRGGKGGFGSLLRGAASKAGHKKTSNFDACRDMSGRRLRHVNAEKKLKEWQEDAPNRQIESVGLDYVEKQSKKRKVESDISQELEKFRAQLEQNSVDVQAAVLDGLKRDAKKKKKKIDDDNKMKSKEIDDSTGDTEQLVEAQVIVESLTTIAEEAEAEVQASESIQPSPELQGGKLPAEDEPVQAVKPAAEAEPVKALEEPAAELNLENVESAKDLEAFGLDKLKSELQKRGLKCGGSLSERAARLFLLKNTPIEKLEKKHFAAKSK